MGYLNKNLLPNERIIYQTRLHWVIYTPGFICLALALLILFAAIQQLPEDRAGYIVASVWMFIIGGLTTLVRWVKRKTSEFGVTNMRVLIKVGLIRRISVELLLRQIEAIGVEQSIAARLLGYGTIVVTGTGGTKEPFSLIASPLEFRRQVQSLTINNDVQ